MPGVAGVNGVSGWELVSALTPAIAVSPGSVLTLTVSCPADKRPLGGGFEALNGALQLNLVSSLPTTSSLAGYGWKVDLRNNTSSAQFYSQIRVYAICGFVQ
jgi:hypothetical protein